MERGHWYDACAAFSWTCWYGNQCYIVLCLVLLGLMVILIFDNFFNTVGVKYGFHMTPSHVSLLWSCFETLRTIMDLVVKLVVYHFATYPQLEYIQKKLPQNNFRQLFWSINFFIPDLTQLWGYLSWNLFCWWLLQTPPYPLQKRFFVPYLELRISRMPFLKSSKRCQLSN